MNLGNYRIIDIINSRNTEDVQKVLNNYPNIEIISRDRGIQYKKLSSNYIHIADRFHLIKNISENIIKSIKKCIPNRIKINIKKESQKVMIKEHEDGSYTKTTAHKDKIELIKQVREEYKKTSNLSKTAKLFKLDRRTVKKYVLMNNIEFESKNARNKRSMLDPYKEMILKEYYNGKKITEIHRMLEIQNIKVKYSTLKHFISKSTDLVNNNELNNKGYIKRRSLINYVLG